MRVLQILFLWAVSSLAHAQSYEPATPELAATVARLAVAAVKMRDEGKPREHLLSALDQQQGTPNRLGLEMRLIVDDIYTHPTVSGSVYFMYTLERFKRELAGKRFPKHFEELASPILACQQSHAASGDVAVNTCVAEAFIAFDTGP